MTESRASAPSSFLLSFLKSKSLSVFSVQQVMRFPWLQCLSLIILSQEFLNEVFFFFLKITKQRILFSFGMKPHPPFQACIIPPPPRTRGQSACPPENGLFSRWGARLARQPAAGVGCCHPLPPLASSPRDMHLRALKWKHFSFVE